MQLTGMRDTMARFVLPAVAPGQSFALEQAGLVLASLGWLIDTNESLTAVAIQEQQDLLDLACELLLLEFGDPESRAALDALLDTGLDATARLETLRERNTLLKAHQARVLESVSAGDAARVAELVQAAALRQVAREQAWGRMTGLCKQATGSIADVLDEQRAKPVTF